MRTGFAAGIEYAEAGQDKPGVPILCLHGIGGSFASFQPQIDALSDRFRILAWNMPGYGHSPLLPDTTFATLTAAVIGLLDELGLEQVHLLGHSIGGMLAQELALTEPERVASLALLATTPAFGGRDDSFRQAFLQARLAPLDAGMSMAELAQGFVGRIVGSGAAPEVMQAAIHSMSAIPEATYRAVLHCLVTFNRYAEVERLGQTACLLAGSEDNTAPARTMQKMAARMPQADFHVLEGAGHLLNLEYARECSEVLTSFFQYAPVV